MQAAPARFANAALWPLTIWTSLTHLEEHPADDYVERTSPIVATAIAFWVCAIALIVLANPAAMLIGGSIGDAPVFSLVRRTPAVVVDVLWLFTPTLYIVGFWLFALRAQAFPR